MSNKTIKPNVDELKAALNEMVSKTTCVTSKAQIAALLPDVEAAQQKGIKLDVIHSTLKDAGLDMSLSTFKLNLYRVRKELKQTN